MRGHFVYVIGREQGPVKVGISSSPRARLDALQTGCPFRLEILHMQKMRDRDHAIYHERVFHDVHAHIRLMGEWFKLPSDLAIESIESSIEFEDFFAKGGAA